MVTRLQPGDPVRVGRYRVLAELGAGGMGRVLLGVGPDGRLVAIKQVHAHLVDEDDFMPRFRREVQTSARVSGAFTAAVIDFDVESEMPWLASVFVPGVPLDAAVQEHGPLSTDQVRTLAIGLASALHAIHGVGLIHRDLKPANVILADDGPRVIDFGIARAAEERSELTHTGSIIGSPAYMSPEQAQSMPLTPASDIFSLGSVLAMAATGNSLFAGSSLPHSLYNIVHTEPDLSGLAPEVRELVQPCLHKEPQARPTPAQILDFLGPLPHAERPWSAAVHEAIGRQSAELSELLGDPEATQIVGAGEPDQLGPSGLDFDSRLRRLAEEAHVHAGRRRRTRLRVAAMAGAVVVAVGAVTGAVILARGERPAASEENALATLNLTALRSLDLCEAIQQPLVGSLGAWKQRPATVVWGKCDAEAGGYHFQLAIERVEGYIDTGDKVHGSPLLREVEEHAGACGRALLPGRTEPQFGVVVRVERDQPGQDLCGLAASAAAELVTRIEDGNPKLPDIRQSLARFDPCGLIDVGVARLNIGSQLRGDADTLHSCKWSGGNSVVVRLERMPTPNIPDTTIPVDTGGPWPTYVDEEEMKNSSSCKRQKIYRSNTDGTAEVITVQAENPRAKYPGYMCAPAVKILENVSNNLPGVYN